MASHQSWFLSGLVTSLQREVAGKEQKIQQLKDEAEKMKKEIREKDNQLTVVSAKVNVPNKRLSNSRSRVWVTVGIQAGTGRASLHKQHRSSVCVAVYGDSCDPLVVATCRQSCSPVSGPCNASGAVSPSPAESPSLFCGQVPCALDL